MCAQSAASVCTVSLGTVWAAVFVSVRSDSVWIFDSSVTARRLRERKGDVLIGLLMALDVLLNITYMVIYSLDNSDWWLAASLPVAR